MMQCLYPQDWIMNVKFKIIIFSWIDTFIRILVQASLLQSTHRLTPSWAGRGVRKLWGTSPSVSRHQNLLFISTHFIMSCEYHGLYMGTFKKYNLFIIALFTIGNTLRINRLRVIKRWSLRDNPTTQGMLKIYFICSFICSFMSACPEIQVFVRHNLTCKYNMVNKLSFKHTYGDFFDCHWAFSCLSMLILYYILIIF